MSEGNCPGENMWGNVHIPTQDYKTLCTTAMICATLVKTDTHIHTDIFDWLYYQLSQRN